MKQNPLTPRVRYSRRFEKNLQKAPTEINRAFRLRLQLLLQSPHHPQLHNHPLTGSFSGYYSINITGDWRALYIKRTGPPEGIIEFHMIGTHSQLY